MSSIFDPAERYKSHHSGASDHSMNGLVDANGTRALLVQLKAHMVPSEGFYG